MSRESVSRLDFDGTAMKLRWPQGHAAVATLGDGKGLTTLTLEFIAELNVVMDLALQGLASSLVIVGTGRSFCVGANLPLVLSIVSESETGPMDLRDRFLQPLAKTFDRLEDMPFPVIAAINGYALGGGCELALSADFRIMGEDTVLGLPEVKIGATPGAGGVQKLIRHVGRSKALEWIILGSQVTAAEAMHRGLLFSVAEKGAVLEAAMSLASEIDKLAPCAIGQAKTSIYLAEDADLQTARRFGVEALTNLASTPEWREGVGAFLEKRAPVFRRGL